MNKYLILDIESVPDDKIKPPEFNKDTVKFGNTKDEAKIQAKIDQAKQEFETGLNKTRSVDSDYCRILSIGYLILDEGKQIIDENVFYSQASDVDILKEFRDVIRSYPDISFMGWNSKAFDLPVLQKRSIRNDLRLWRGSEFIDLIGRYSSNHIDLMHIWNTSWPSMGKMSACCDYLGIESKTDMDGSMIYEAFKLGEHDKIKDYNLEDCHACYEIAKKIYF